MMLLNIELRGHCGYVHSLEKKAQAPWGNIKALQDMAFNTSLGSGRHIVQWGECGLQS